MAHPEAFMSPTTPYSVKTPTLHRSPILIEVSPDSVPVLPLHMADEEEAETYIMMALTFLRCGCPQVQFLLPYAKEPARKRFSKMHNLVQEFQLEGERFTTARPRDRERICSIGRVALRKTPPP
jgi:hypothetical protein